MYWDRHLHALIPQNPVVKQELYRQQKNSSVLSKFIETTGIVAVALCCTLAMFFFVVQGLHNENFGGWYSRAAIEFIVWILHGIVVFRLILAGASAVSTERYLLGSEDLMVTPLTNWQFISGKWWAALHQTRGWMLALGIVQLGIVASLGFGLQMDVAWSMSCGNPCVVTIYGLAHPEWLTPSRLLFITGSAIWLTLLEILCCTALGMAGSLLMGRKFGVIFAVATRFAPILIFSYFPDFSWSDSPFGRYFGNTWFSFADAGTGSLIQMTHPINIVASGFDRGVLGLLVVTVMFLLYLRLSLTTVLLAMRRVRQ